MRNRAARLLFVMLVMSLSVLAQSTYKGIRPGESTKLQVQRVLGRPVKQVSDTLTEYAPQAGAQKIYVQYRAGSQIAERVVVLLDDPGQRAALLTRLGLPPRSSARRVNERGKLEEYFGPPKSIVLIYEGEEADRDVGRVEYYSQELFQSAVADLSTPANTSGGAGSPGASTRKDISGGIQLTLRFNSPINASKLPGDRLVGVVTSPDAYKDAQVAAHVLREDDQGITVSFDSFSINTTRGPVRIRLVEPKNEGPVTVFFRTNGVRAPDPVSVVRIEVKNFASELR